MFVRRSEVSCLLFDPARQLGHGRERDVGVVRRQAATASPRCARTGRAPGPASRRQAPGSTASPERAPARARSFADRRAARAAAPSTAASSPPPSRARRRSSSPARASRLRRTWTATPAGRRPARCRRSAARPASPGGAGDRDGLRIVPARDRGASAPSGAVIRNCRRVFTASGARFLTRTLVSRQCESYAVLPTLRDAASLRRSAGSDTADLKVRTTSK